MEALTGDVTTSRSEARDIVTQPRMTDQSGVLAGLGGLALLILAAAVPSGMPVSWAVAAMLLCTVLLAAPLRPGHALLLGVTGWALADGFFLHAYGQLGLTGVNLVLLATFVAGAVLPWARRRKTA